MRNIRSQARKRNRNYGFRLFVAIVLFAFVLALTVLLVMHMNGYFAPPVEPIPDSGITDGDVVPDTPSDGEVDGSSQPQYPAEEPIYEPLYGEQYSTFRLPRKTEEFAFIEKIIEIALSEPKEPEDERGATKYGTYFGTPTWEWCTEFAVWCILQAQESLGVEYLKVHYPFEDWSGGCVQWYKEKGLFFKKGTYVPRRGDMIFFDYDYDGSTDHTGLVTGIEYDETEDKLYVLTVEGNLPEDYPVGTIKERRLAIDWKKIYGYGTFLFSE